MKLDTETGKLGLLKGDGRNAHAAYGQSDQCKTKKNIPSIQSKVIVWVFVDFCAKLMLLLSKKANENFFWKI